MHEVPTSHTRLSDEWSIGSASMCVKISNRRPLSQPVFRKPFRHLSLASWFSSEYANFEVSCPEAVSVLHVPPVPSSSRPPLLPSYSCSSCPHLHHPTRPTTSWSRLSFIQTWYCPDSPPSYPSIGLYLAHQHIYRKHGSRSQAHRSS